MVLVDIQPEEIKALGEALKDVKCSVQVGYILVSFRVKIQQTVSRELERQKKIQAKKILGLDKNEKKEKSG